MTMLPTMPPFKKGDLVVAKDQNFGHLEVVEARLTIAKGHRPWNDVKVVQTHGRGEPFWTDSDEIIHVATLILLDAIGGPL